MTKQDVIDFISNMSVLALAELIKELEEKFGVSAAAATVAVAAAPGEAAPVVEEKTEFDVKLTSCGDKKIQVIKVIRALTGLGLKEAKAVADETPSVVKEGVSKEEAESIKKELEEAGGTIEIV
ncbi:MAG: 50S ribosomal protein L7/L12 [Deltaproteobacteria bacterium]|nr:50S ribosomal protein L7/L12 [Deltaproteobacteria bacterium]